jgi:hypothetical protein
MTSSEYVVAAVACIFPISVVVVVSFNAMRRVGSLFRSAGV